MVKSEIVSKQNIIFYINSCLLHKKVNEDKAWEMLE